MPIATEPNQTFRVVLEIDKDKPAEQRPYFEFRFLSVRRWNELAKIADSFKDSNAVENMTDEEAKDPNAVENMTGEQATAKVFEMIRFGLVGWGNMTNPQTRQAIPFDPNELDGLLTLQETQEMLVKFRNQGLDVEDKKKSDSQSGLGMEQSASDAGEQQSAATSPTPSNP